MKWNPFKNSSHMQNWTIFFSSPFNTLSEYLSLSRHSFTFTWFKGWIKIRISYPKQNEPRTQAETSVPDTGAVSGWCWPEIAEILHIPEKGMVAQSFSCLEKVLILICHRIGEWYGFNLLRKIGTNDISSKIRESVSYPWFLDFESETKTEIL